MKQFIFNMFLDALCFLQTQSAATESSFVSLCFFSVTVSNLPADDYAQNMNLKVRDSYFEIFPGCIPALT